MKRLVLAGVATAVLGGGCGASGDASGDTMVATGSGEDSSGSPAPSTSSVDSGPQDHGHTECEIGAPPECLLVGDDGICSDVLTPAECVDGAWACPQGSVELRACPPDTGSTGADTTGAGGSGSSSDTGSGSDTGATTSASPTTVAAGTRHTCVVADDGGVKCWGSGTNGALGYGNESDIGAADTPADHGYVDVGGIAVEVAAGFGISCALLDDGTVTCWGAMTALGYGDAEHVGDDEAPADVGTIDIGAPVQSLTAGSSHVCAHLDTDEVKCWGSNGRGQLGQGDTEAIGDDELPSSIDPIDLGGPVQKVRAGFDFTCAWLQSGDVRCWGYGENGRLGLGGIENLGDDELPSSVPPVDLGGGTVADLTVGAGHACVLFDDGAVTCWGVGVFGALGYASLDHIGDDELPGVVGPVDLGAIATAVWAGAHNTCARLADTSIVCWGHGDLGANGYGSTDTIGDDETPAGLPPVSFGAELQQLTEGQGEHFCGVSDEGLVCWGFNGWGQLGLGQTGNVGDDEVPSDVGVVPL